MKYELNRELLLKYTDEETLNKIVPYESVSEMWKNCVSNYSDLVAIVDKGEYTYSQIEEDAKKIRGNLESLGIKKGDRVGVYMLNSYDFVRAYIATVTYGAVAVLLPPQLDENTVFGCSYKYAIKMILTDSILQAKTKIAVDKLSIKSLTFDELEDSSLDIQDVASDDPCVIVFTGGTTGRSKGALLSNKAIITGTLNGCYFYKNVFNQRYFLVLPLTHVFGLIRNLMTSLYTGSSLYICRDNKEMFREIQVFQPTILVLVPALAEMALNLSKQFGRNMLGDSVKAIICGAAVVAPYLVEEYKNYGIVLYPGYGLTESANLVSGNPESLSKPESVGLPYPNQELKIVDGELWLKGDNIMMSYDNDKEENELAFSDGWFKTGDLVRFDDEGFLYITGRIKEVIVLPSGENISPAELEARFNEQDCIQDSLVYLDNDVLAVQVYPRQVVLAKLGVENAEEYVKEKVNEVNMNLLPYQRVNKIVIRDKDFERSPSMKILRDKNGTK